MFACLSPCIHAAEPIALSENTYKPSLGVIIMQANWGRAWKCGRFENAQLENLTFTKLPIDAPDQVSVELDTPSKLFVDSKFVPYVLVVQPGDYALAAFDVKIARSVSDVAHIKGTKEMLMKDGKAIGGSFTVNAGEVVYVGHFGLDCNAEPFLWRYYIEGRSEFERYVAGFREKYPFMKDSPVTFRLFASDTLGHPYSLTDPIVK